jgi:hypothetical protein
VLIRAIYKAKYKLTGYSINIKFHPIAQHYWICDPTVPEMKDQPFCGFYDPMTIQEAVEPMASTGMHWIYQNDIVWQKCMAKGNWFHFKKRLGFQRLGFSNLSNQVVDHTMDGV